VREKCTIWSVQKFGSLVQVLTAFNSAERMVPPVSSGIINSVLGTPCRHQEKPNRGNHGGFRT